MLVYLTAILPDDVFKSLTREDGIFENLSALFFLATSILFFLLFSSTKYFNDADIKNRYVTRGSRVFFLIFGLVFFFGFGEEISWGQRIFGFQTPEKMMERNVQEEFNLHNMEFFNIRNKDGERKEGIQKLFTMKQMFLGSFFMYLFVLPLAVKYSSKVRNLTRKIFLPVPSIWLGVFFLGNYIVYRISRGVFPWETQWGLTELQEFNFSIILMLLPFCWFAFNRSESASLPETAY